MNHPYLRPNLESNDSEERPQLGLVVQQNLTNVNNTSGESCSESGNSMDGDSIRNGHGGNIGGGDFDDGDDGDSGGDDDDSDDDDHGDSEGDSGRDHGDSDSDVGSHDADNDTDSGDNNSDSERGNEDEMGGDGGRGNENEIELAMEKCILRILESKIKFGWSQEEALSQLRSLYELTANQHIPHKTWQMVLKFLKKLGYKTPRHYKVCCGTDHVTLVDGEACPNCNNPSDKCTDYFVLGLNVDSFFASKEKVCQHLAHWENRAEWFNKQNIEVPFKEVWHGSRFRDLSYFWDEDKETVMPTCCPNCDNLISVEEINLASEHDIVEPNYEVH